MSRDMRSPSFHLATAAMVCTDSDINKSLSTNSPLQPTMISSIALRTLRTLVYRSTPSTSVSIGLSKPHQRGLSSATLQSNKSSYFRPIFRTPSAILAAVATRSSKVQARVPRSTGPSSHRLFSTTTSKQATYNQVRRGCRTSQRARRARSPALAYHPQMKGVCLKTGITKPKKPNSGERKTARVRLSSGKVVTVYIPGEGKQKQYSTRRATCNLAIFAIFDRILVLTELFVCLEKVIMSSSIVSCWSVVGERRIVPA